MRVLAEPFIKFNSRARHAKCGYNVGSPFAVSVMTSMCGCAAKAVFTSAVTCSTLGGSMAAKTGLAAVSSQ